MPEMIPTAQPIEFKMPSLGADMEAGFLREWKVKPGDRVKRGDIIAEVETQKGIIDIEVFDSGTIDRIIVKENEKVPVGTTLAIIIPAAAFAQSQVVMPGSAVDQVLLPVAHVRASPLAKRMASELGVDINHIKGTGQDGAITKADVERSVQERASPVQKKKAATPIENIRAAVAAAMSKSNREVPHYYLQTRVDMSHALTWLATQNKERTIKNRLLPAVLYIKSVANALRDVPDLNAYWLTQLERQPNIHIGFVVSMRTGGIMVPAIRDADKKTVDEVMHALTDIITRVRSMRLRSSDLSDSTLTITSLGVDGVEAVYGVIYPPQVALVGFGAITDQPWAHEGMVGVRPILTVTLSADHRATDGGTGSRFLSAVKTFLEKPQTIWETKK